MINFPTIASEEPIEEKKSDSSLELGEDDADDVNRRINTQKTKKKSELIQDGTDDDAAQNAAYIKDKKMALL